MHLAALNCFACSKYRVASTDANSAASREANKPILNPGEETMKIRLLLTLAGLAISFALPAFAQQTNTPDPQVRQQYVALAKKFDEA